MFVGFPFNFEIQILVSKASKRFSIHFKSPENSRDSSFFTPHCAKTKAERDEIVTDDNHLTGVHLGSILIYFLAKSLALSGFLKSSTILWYYI